MLGLKLRLVTAEEFADAAQRSSLYPLLVEDAARHCTSASPRFPKPVDRTAGTLALILLLLLIWPHLDSKHMLSPHSPVSQPPIPIPPPPQESPDGRRDQQQQSSPAPQQSPGGGGQGPSQTSAGGGTDDRQHQAGAQQPSTGGGAQDANAQPNPSQGTQQRTAQGGEGQGSQPQHQTGAGTSGSMSAQNTQGAQRPKTQPQQNVATTDTPTDGSSPSSTHAKQHGGEAAQANRQSSAQGGSQQMAGNRQSASASGSQQQAAGQQGAQQTAQARPLQGASGQQQHAGGGGSQNEALQAQIQQLLQEVSGEIKDLQAQLASEAPRPTQPEIGTGTDPGLYDAPSKLEAGKPGVGVLPIQLKADSAPTKAQRPGQGVGPPSETVSGAGPKAELQNAQLADEPTEEHAGSRQIVPPEYQSVFDRLRKQPSEQTR